MSKYTSMIVAVPLLLFLTISITKETKAPFKIPTDNIETSILVEPTPKKIPSERTREELEEVFAENPNDKETLLALINIYLQNIADRHKGQKLLIEYEKQLYFDSEFTALKTKNLLGEEQYQKAEESINILPVIDANYLKAIKEILQGNLLEAEPLLKEPVNEKEKENAQKLLLTYQKFRKHRDAPLIYLKILIAQKLLEQKEYRITEVLVNQVLSENKTYRDAWTILGYSLFSQENYPKALTAFLEAYGLDKANAKIQYFLGLTYGKLSDLEKSTKFLQYALQNQFVPKNEPLKKIAENYLKDGNLELSAYYFEKVIEEDPTDKYAYASAIKIYLQNPANLREAENLAIKTIRQFPKDPMSYNLLARTKLNQGQNVEAIKKLEEAISLDPNLPETHLSLGQAYEEINPAKALEHYLKAKTLSPKTEIGIEAGERYNHLLLN